MPASRPIKTLQLLRSRGMGDCIVPLAAAAIKLDAAGRKSHQQVAVSPLAGGSLPSAVLTPPAADGGGASLAKTCTNCRLGEAAPLVCA